MAKRTFTPADPNGDPLELRLAPSSGINGFFHDTFKKIGDNLSFKHHHNKNAAAGIDQMWKDRDALSRPTHPTHASAHHHHPKGY